MPRNLGFALNVVYATNACLDTSDKSARNVFVRSANHAQLFSLSGAHIVAQGIVSVNVGREKTGSKKTEWLRKARYSYRAFLFCQREEPMLGFVALNNLHKSNHCFVPPRCFFSASLTEIHREN